MRTLGVDLSSQSADTAACFVEWEARPSRVIRIVRNVDDELATELMSDAQKVGIDIPLGWPVGFARAVAAHSDGAVWPADYHHADASAFQLRRTDLAVRELLGMRPFSVSADKIAVPAMRAAALLSTLTPVPPRDGSGLIVEVYPAAALRRWGFPWRLYKGPKRAAERARLVALVLERIPWLEVADEERKLCEASDHAFDALVAALVARAAAVGAVEPIPAEEQLAAAREGWIAIPTVDSLAQLAATPV